MKHNVLLKRAFSILLTVAMLAGMAAPAYANTAAQWPTFRGGDNGVVDAATPRTAQETGRAWKTRLKATADWKTNVSDPLIIGGDIYIAAENSLKVINAKTGAVKTTFALDVPIDLTCRMLFAAGRLFVPLPEGRLEAISISDVSGTAPSLAKSWTTEALTDDPIGGPHQPQTTLLYDSGRVYMGTVCADWTQSYAGTYRCIDASTGDLVWEHENSEAGYYWSGGTIVNGAFVFAGDDGVLTSVDASDGTTITAGIDLGAAMRATIVPSDDPASGYIFAVSQNGTLHRATVAPNGTLGDVRSVSFADSSTSTPVVYDGKVYVGGSTATWTGSLSVINANTMAVERTVGVPAAVQGSPIVSTGNADGAYVYFTANGSPGGMYTYKAGASAASMIYVPTGDEANYSMSTPAVDTDGTIYYTNDSGYLFALQTIPTVRDVVIKSVKATAYNKATVIWGAVPGASGYNVEYRTGGGAWKTVKVVGGTKTSVSLSGLKTGKKCEVRIKAYKTVDGRTGTSVAYSKTLSATPKLAKVVGVKTKKASRNSIKVSWKGVSGSSKYVVEQKIGKGKWKVIKTTSVKSFTKKSLKKGKTYAYRVRAYRVVDGKRIYGAYSSTVKRTLK